MFLGEPHFAIFLKNLSVDNSKSPSNPVVNILDGTMQFSFLKVDW